MSVSPALRTFRTALIWAAVFSAVALLWLLRDAMLIGFGAILGALLLTMLAENFTRWTPLPHGLAILASVLVIVAVCGIVVWLFGAQVTGQLVDVFERVRDAEQQISQQLAQNQASGLAHRLISSATGLIGDMLAYTASTLMSLVEGVLIVVISAIYLAAEPETYRRGLVLLFPPSLHPWADSTIGTIRESLRLWLLGQLVLMLVTGVLSFLAVWAIGLPSPIGLGVIAGITEIVPYVGPFIGGIPALLVAITLGVWPTIWTLLAYIGVHIVEGYLMAPLIQRRFVHIPPAVMLIGITAMSLIWGFVGVLFAAPLTVALFVAVKLFYVRQTLDEPVELPRRE